MIVIAQQLINGVMLGAVYMTVAVAFTLTIGILNFLNFTIPGLFMLSAMVAWGVLARGVFHFAGPLAWVLALVSAPLQPSSFRCWWSASPTAT